MKLDYNGMGERAIVMLPVSEQEAPLFVGDGHTHQGKARISEAPSKLLRSKA
jgi:acetamidase/formamidase